MNLKTTKWNIADHLGSEEKIALFLEAVIEEGDPATITSAKAETERVRKREKPGKAGQK